MNTPTVAPKFNYGGQAVIEGVMMRGSKTMAVAVRNPQHEIVLHTQPLNQKLYGTRMMRIPFLRGLTLLWDALGLGMRSLMYSADVALGEEDVKFSGPVAWGTILISLAFGLGLFILLPKGVTALFENRITPLVSALIEGAVRLALFVGYIWLIGKMNDIRRVFGYHGAEHKTINAYEAGAELTVESVQRFPLSHPRCGTAFLLTVVVLSIFFFAPLNTLNLPLLVSLLSRIVLIPLVAMVAYEYIRFSARHLNHPLIRAIIVPNLALQSLTTRQPDDTMVEVAITAFKRVLESEKAGAPEPSVP
ncbi:MAG TPA: DUF1385 domain-containing protein [Anaerolineae bacterium]|nr:DUF1385 domain-containing protein [Anaerolineae bacterium]